MKIKTITGFGDPDLTDPVYCEYDLEISKEKLEKFLKDKFGIENGPLITIKQSPSFHNWGEEIMDNAYQFSGDGEIIFIISNISLSAIVLNVSFYEQFLNTFKHELSHFILDRSKGLTAFIHRHVSKKMVIPLSLLPLAAFFSLSLVWGGAELFLLFKGISFYIAASFSVVLNGFLIFLISDFIRQWAENISMSIEEKIAEKFASKILEKYEKEIRECVTLVPIRARKPKTLRSRFRTMNFIQKRAASKI